MNDENGDRLASPSGVVPLGEVAVKLHPRDDVAVAKIRLKAGMTLTIRDDPPSEVSVRQLIPSGHKIALQGIPAGDPVHRYGQVIGFASRDIAPGDHVHTHNAGVQDFDRAPTFSSNARSVEHVPESERRTFLGYQRDDGRVGTRNYVVVISTVNCSAHTSREIARHFTSERLAPYPNVDGVIALTHKVGCAQQAGSPGYTFLQRTLRGMARHPNVGARILVGLGCETNQVDDLAGSCCLGGEADSTAPCLVIQETGGIDSTVRAGIAAIEELLPQVDAVERTSHPISELTLALQCGGSDGWSGVTANPAVGLVADSVVRQGGTVVLAETPEIFGAEHLLTRRAVSPEVGRELVELVRWWEERARRLGVEIDHNRSAGNEAGGLTTIYEKALGAVAKGGSTPLTAVYDYAEPVVDDGLVFMNSPGFDPVSVTGQIAAGCDLVLFTTGRGSVFGSKPAPTIKISTNSTTYERMTSDVDLNAGRILDGARKEEVAAELLDLIVAVASGQPSKSEAQGVGEAEFSPWNLGEIL